VVARGMGLDERIGPRFLAPGPGFGGSCFPKDTRAVAQIATDQGLRFEIIEAVLSANERIQRRMVDKVERAMGSVAGKRVALLGLSFKADTDDMRESPAIPLIEGLLAKGAIVCAHDPAATEQAKTMLPPIEYCDDPYVAAKGADALVIVTEWNQFRALELGELKELLETPLIVDLRNIYDPSRVAAAGLRYVSIGRPERAPGSAA